MPPQERPANHAASASSAVDSVAGQTLLEKTCNKCGRPKPLSEFYRAGRPRRGYRSECKACYGARCTAYVARNQEKIRLYYLLRDPEKARAAGRRWRRNNPEALRRKARRLYAAHRQERLAYYAAYRRKNKHKSRAHAAVRTALTLGDLVRRPCEICTSIGRPSDRRKTVAHHEDYDRPLEVRWLCHGHHQQVHRRTICLLPPSGQSGAAASPLPGDVAFRALAR